MKVEELIQELQKFPSGAEVYFHSNGWGLIRNGLLMTLKDALCFDDEEAGLEHIEVHKLNSASPCFNIGG